MSHRIMIVDDDREIREILTFALTRHGFDVVVAENGQQFRQELPNFKPEVILLDVMMPGLDGYKLFTQLRQEESTRDIPVIIMTAHDEDIYERISIDLGASLHVTKPFHPLDLVEKVRTLLQHTSGL